MSGATDYNVYRGDVGELAQGVPPGCHADEITGTSYMSAIAPDPGAGFAFLVTAEDSAGNEGIPGDRSDSSTRDLLGNCDSVVRHQLLDRLGYGWSEWNADRLETLGPAAYIAEQLDPSTIDETSNTDLNTRTARWRTSVDGYPEIITDLGYLRIEESLYARRQLEQVMTEFWANHFTTNYVKTIEYMIRFFPGDNEELEQSHRATSKLHREEEDRFRDIAFSGDFREILEASALSPVMQIYLDGVNNVVGRPNENLSREILELHAKGVDCGYTETDIREFARALTGWTVCKHASNTLDEPLAPCIDPLFGGAGGYVSHFEVANHDPTSKTLFAGTPYELIIPDTSGNPAEGVNDVQLVLDAIVADPCVANFINEKLLRRFAADDPDPAQIASAVSAWNASSGDLVSVLADVIKVENTLDPALASKKIKSPQEHVYSAYRAIRGKTDGVFSTQQLGNWISVMQHFPYLRESPDGYPERAEAWLTTNQFLARQDMGTQASVIEFLYHGEINQMVAENNLQTALEIVDFFANILFGGAITPAERQLAIDFLETDDLGNPSPYDDARVRDTVGAMLGFLQFMER